MTSRGPAGAGNMMRRDLDHVDRPPAVAVRYFYTSPLAIDDPLSPLPPASSAGSTSSRVPPRPLSAFDNAALDKAWLDVRKKRLRLGERGANEKRLSKELEAKVQDERRGSVTNYSAAEAKRRSVAGSITSMPPPSPRHRPQRMPSNDLLNSQARSRAGTLDKKTSEGSKPSSLRAENASFSGVDTSTVTGNPFVRAPSKKDVGSSSRSRSTSVRPVSQKLDSYDWEDAAHASPTVPSRDQSTKRPEPSKPRTTGPQEKVPVGVSRLHEVVVPDLQYVVFSGQRLQR